MTTLTKIVSGGQTGVDRGALDAATARRFPCGGWCPAVQAGLDKNYKPMEKLFEEIIERSVAAS